MGANLVGANLLSAKLARADLREADFTGASLFLADLSETRLIRTNLSTCHLQGAKFKGAETEETNVNRAAVGELGSVLEDLIFRENLSWRVCMIGKNYGFDANRYSDDSSAWLTRSGYETIFEAALRQLGASTPNSIHLTFQESVWRDLVVIETGLRELFGESVDTKKTKGALAVKFQSTEDLQQGLDAVFVQLAAKTLQGSETIDSLVVQGEGEDCQVFTPEHLIQGQALLWAKLNEMGNDMTSIKGLLPSPELELTDNQETLAKMAEDIPILKYFSHRFRRWLTERDVREAGELQVGSLFQWALNGFRWSAEARQLRGKPPNAEVLEERRTRNLPARRNEEG